MASFNRYSSQNFSPSAPSLPENHGQESFSPPPPNPQQPFYQPPPPLKGQQSFSSSHNPVAPGSHIYGQPGGAPSYGQPGGPPSYGQPSGYPSYGQSSDVHSQAQPSYGQSPDVHSQGQSSYGQSLDTHSHIQPVQPNYGQSSQNPDAHGPTSYGQQHSGAPSYGQPSGHPSYGQSPDHAKPSYGQTSVDAHYYGRPGLSSDDVHSQGPSAYGQKPSAYGQTPSAYGQPPSAYGQPSVAGGFFPAGTNPEIVRSFQTMDKDRSGSIDEKELQEALTFGYQKFSIRTVRLLMFLFKNPNQPLKVGPNEFAALWNCLGEWRGIFERFDRDRSGKIDLMELRDALQSLGYLVPPSVLQVLMSKYEDGSTKKGELNFDSFVECGMIIKGLTEKFKEKDTRFIGTATLNYETFMLMVIPFIVS